MTSEDLLQPIIMEKYPPVLMKLTGHSRESTFLEYVGKNANMDTYADILMYALSK